MHKEIKYDLKHPVSAIIAGNNWVVMLPRFKNKLKLKRFIHKHFADHKGETIRIRYAIFKPTWINEDKIETIIL